MVGGVGDNAQKEPGHEYHREGAGGEEEEEVGGSVVEGKGGEAGEEGGAEAERCKWKGGCGAAR